MKNSMICIYCKKAHKLPSIEHVIPESIGCPSDAILQNGQVCEKCNKLLGKKLDLHVKDAFDILAFEYNIKRKKGKSAIISSRGNLRAEYAKGKANIYINNSNAPIVDNGGQRLPAYNKSNPRHIDAKFSRNGNEISLNFSVIFGDSPKFIRGIFKIALAAFALEKGSAFALDSQYDDLRKYINEGFPIYQCICIKEKNSPIQNSILHFWEKDGLFLVPIRLFGIDFLCDISPKQQILPIVLDAFYGSYGKNGWTCLPVK